MQGRGSAFAEKVFDLVKKIPSGKVKTYGEIARLAGKPGAARAVGQILGKNSCGFLSGRLKKELIPCHRVVKSDGTVGGYQAGEKAKIKLLRYEGVRIVGGKITRLGNPT